MIWQVKVEWGSDGALFEQTDTYKFNTEAECKAFVRGISEAIDWDGHADWDVIPPSALEQIAEQA